MMELPPFKLEIVSEDAVSPELDAAIKDLLCECFPVDTEEFRKSRHWHGSAPAYSLVYRQGSSVPGHVGIVRRTITCAGRPVEVAGIESLAVSPTLRGSGLSRQLMIESMAEAKRKGIKFGFLFCSPKLERFYASLGWRRTNAAVTMLDQAGRDVPLPEKSIAMSLDLADETFPDGEIDLQGRDW
jgi:predicted N-acetyltransferase YhbS